MATSTVQGHFKTVKGKTIYVRPHYKETKKKKKSLKDFSDAELRVYTHTMHGFHDKVGRYLGQGMTEKQAVKRAEDEIIEKIKICFS